MDKSEREVIEARIIHLKETLAGGGKDELKKLGGLEYPISEEDVVKAKTMAEGMADVHFALLNKDFQSDGPIEMVMETSTSFKEFARLPDGEFCRVKKAHLSAFYIQRMATLKLQALEALLGA